VSDLAESRNDHAEADQSAPPATESEQPAGPEIIEAFTGSAEEWDAALTGLENASFCHRYGWREVMDGALGHESFWWVARDTDGNATGVLPVVRVRSRLFGDYLVSMPFLSYGGPAGSAETRRMLAEHAAKKAGSLGVDLLELRGRVPTKGTGLLLSERKLTVIKALPESTEELWEKGIKAKLRSQIRRPIKEGMEVRFGPELVDDFYAVFSRTMRDLGTPVLPKRFFDAIRIQLGDSAIFAVVEHQGAPIAAACGLSWDDEFEITWAGSSREHQRLAPNMLLYWGLMEECTRRKFKAFNFGRCSPDSGTHRFKKQWGSEDHALPWLQWSSSGVPSTPNPDSPKFRMATSAWSRLPVSVTNVIGPHLSRLIP
jgi:serine/alanine adding enzyme